MSFRAGVVAVLVLLLLIPLAMVEELVREREYRKDDAMREVGQVWGGNQVLTGPVLSVPFMATERVVLDNGRTEARELVRYAHFLPESLEVACDLVPEKRHRGIYDVAVYKAHLSLKAVFPALEGLSPAKGAKLQWGEATLNLGISDLRSIKNLVVEQKPAGMLPFEPGLPSSDVAMSGLSAAMPMDSAARTRLQHVSLTLDVNGSGTFRVVPVGRTTRATITSTWPDPSFQGAFLPDSSHIGPQGFSAQWSVLHLNRTYPQEFTGDLYAQLDASAFGADLLMLVDEYRKSTRAIKYGVMLIVMVFLVLFFVEVLQKLRIHPIQYLLVGFALCLFYTLLIALGEHIGFTWAYIVSAVATIALVVFYAKGVFRVARATQLLGLVMLLVFGFMLTIILQEDYALLMGSIGLFIVLAIVMAVSRKIDWNKTGD